MTVLILSKQKVNSSLLRLEQELIRAHLDPLIIDPSEILLEITPRGTLFFHSNPDIEKRLQNIKAAIPRLGAISTNQGLPFLFALESKGIPTLNKCDSILKTRDKILSLILLSQNRVPIPKSYYGHELIHKNVSERHLSDGGTVIKLSEGAQGVGVMWSQSPAAAASIMSSLEFLNKNYFAQDMIHESFGRDIRAFVLYGKVIASMERTAPLGELRSNLHMGGKGVATQLSDEETSLALKACELLELDCAGVDLLRTIHGPLVLEVNASPGLEGIEEATGINVAAQIANGLRFRIK